MTVPVSQVLANLQAPPPRASASSGRALPPAPTFQSVLASTTARTGGIHATLDALRDASKRGSGSASTASATQLPTTTAPATTQSSAAAGLLHTAAPAPSAPAARTASHKLSPMPLNQFPRPEGDNGWGMHWIPTVHSTPEVVDKFVGEAKDMGVKWMVFLNDGAKIDPANDYLVKKLTEAGIEPVMRLYSPTLQPLQGDVEGMVRHYSELGVHYFQPFNEPNLNVEQPDGRASVDRYLDTWLPAAKAIVRGGGLPGFGALAPGGDANDVEFLRQAVRGIKQRGELGTLDKAWLSVHNYAHNHPVETEGMDDANVNGFGRTRSYKRVLEGEIGRVLPMLGTEGGAYVGDKQDPSRPALDEKAATESVREIYQDMKTEREPWNFAYSYWVIANEAGGGTDAGFSRMALFKPDGTHSALVDQLKAMS